MAQVDCMTSTLEFIATRDPDSFPSRPTAAQYANFQQWVVETYGPATWQRYHENWGPTSDV